jgi:UDP-N-acetylmuramate--alanine ligase
MSVPGRHNLFNGLCAIAVGDRLGVSFEALTQALQSFTGMGRRFECIGDWNQALLIDDYAHHPSEVAATLKAARESLEHSPGRVIAVFQPHRFSRLKALWEQFTTCFDEADEVYITDVYAAHEPEIPGISSKMLVEEIRRRIVSEKKSSETVYLRPDGVHYISYQPDFSALREALKQKIKPGDRVLSMGAGNITKLLRTPLG